MAARKSRGTPRVEYITALTWIAGGCLVLGLGNALAATGPLRIAMLAVAAIGGGLICFDLVNQRRLRHAKPVGRHADSEDEQSDG